MRLEVTVGPHPMLGLTLARVMMIVIDELHADHIPLHQVEVGVDGLLPDRMPRP